MHLLVKSKKINRTFHLEDEYKETMLETSMNQVIEELFYSYFVYLSLLGTAFTFDEDTWWKESSGNEQDTH